MHIPFVSLLQHMIYNSVIARMWDINCLSFCVWHCMLLVHFDFLESSLGVHEDSKAVYMGTLLIDTEYTLYILVAQGFLINQTSHLLKTFNSFRFSLKLNKWQIQNLLFTLVQSVYHLHLTHSMRALRITCAG